MNEEVQTGLRNEEGATFELGDKWFMLVGGSLTSAVLLEFHWLPSSSSIILSSPS